LSAFQEKICTGSGRTESVCRPGRCVVNLMRPCRPDRFRKQGIIYLTVPRLRGMAVWCEKWEDSIMPEIIIATESGSDLPEEIVRQYQIEVAPMHVIMNNVSYDDGHFPIDMVFDYFEKTGKIPTTSAVNVQEYVDFWNDIRSRHPGCIIYHFTYSSNASSTHQHAVAARDQENFRDLYIIDTKSVSGGCTAHIEACCRMLEKRKNSITDSAAAGALAEEFQALADRIECNFIPATLDYLRAGGRVSNGAYIAANVLRLKPLIEINREGFLVATKKFRGSMDKITDKFMQMFLQRHHLNHDTLYLMYGPGLSQSILDRMREIALENGFQRTVYVMTGCTISCHGGKGAIGLAGVTE
jgi:DegV family protein with EDD domain